MVEPVKLAGAAAKLAANGQVTLKGNYQFLGKVLENLQAMGLGRDKWTIGTGPNSTFTLTLDAGQNTLLVSSILANKGREATGMINNLPSDVVMAVNAPLELMGVLCKMAGGRDITVGFPTENSFTLNMDAARYQMFVVAASELVQPTPVQQVAARKAEAPSEELAALKQENLQLAKQLEDTKEALLRTMRDDIRKTLKEEPEVKAKEKRNERGSKQLVQPATTAEMFRYAKMAGFEVGQLSPLGRAMHFLCKASVDALMGDATKDYDMANLPQLLKYASGGKEFALITRTGEPAAIPRAMNAVNRDIARCAMEVVFQMMPKKALNHASIYMPDKTNKINEVYINFYGVDLDARVGRFKAIDFLRLALSPVGRVDELDGGLRISLKRAPAEAIVGGEYPELLVGDVKTVSKGSVVKEKMAKEKGKAPAPKPSKFQVIGSWLTPLLENAQAREAALADAASAGEPAKRKRGRQAYLTDADKKENKRLYNQNYRLNLKKNKAGRRDTHSEEEKRIYETVKKLAAYACSLEKEGGQGLKANLAAKNLRAIIEGTFKEFGALCEMRFKDMPSNLYFDSGLLGGILKIFALKAIRNIKAGNVKALQGTIMPSDEAGKVKIVMRNVANGIGMISDGTMVNIGKRVDKIVMVKSAKKSKVDLNTRGSLGEGEAATFNKALDLLKAERSPIGDDGVQLIVPGTLVPEEKKQGRGRKKG
ncbi:MAG: hypothetical protein WC861_06190 [Candidatus Micrarchaeia archaeon]|jgi:hypothetical protein